MKKNSNVSVFIVDAAEVQLKIKQLVWNGVRRGRSERAIKAEAKKIIDDFCEKTTDKQLQNRARLTLIRAFVRWYSAAVKAFSTLPAIILARFVRVPSAVQKRADKQMAALPPRMLQGDVFLQRLTPLPENGRQYHDAEYRKQLKQAFSRLATKLADDEAIYSGHVSLRNLAEIEVRRNEIQQLIASWRTRGVRLVWVSSHANCSKRCEPWQGRLYSLDGSSGTENGNNFVPIETAINVVDKYGNINGLFGYNCRHRLYEYKTGSRPPQEYTEAQMKIERAIDARQRSMERLVRRWKMRGHLLKPVDTEASRAAFARARDIESAYEKYSHANGRAFYRERTAVLTEEIEFAKRQGK